MAIEGFDYQGFATEMAKQAQELVPPEFNEMQREYIVKTIENFTRMAGEALYNDTSVNFNADQAILISQIIAEWSFHKSIDLIHSQIMPEFWDGIMQKIAFTIFEVAKQALIRNIPQDQMLQAIEHHVNKAYVAGLDALEKKKVITAEMKEHAAKQSNIDDMAKKVQEEEAAQAPPPQATSQAVPQQQNRPVPQQAGGRPASVTGKSARLLSVALLLKILSQDKVVTILNKFSAEDSQVISQYMQTQNLESQIDPELACQCLKEMKDYLPRRPKLTEANVIRHLQRSFDRTSRDNVEKLIKYERPYVKRFISAAYDDDYYKIPLRVAGVIAQYVQDSI